MPIYEYQCSHCHTEFEAIQKINDTPLTHCDSCGLETAIRLVSAPGFQLKGTGWYATDFKDKPKASSQSEASAQTIDQPSVSKEVTKKES